MSSKRKARLQTPPPPPRNSTANRGSRALQKRPEKRILGLPARAAALLGALVVIAVLAIGGVAVLSGTGGRTPTPTQYAVDATGGTWTNVNADRLAEMLREKDFTLLNVKTPYIGEISGTDLYIPYNQLTSRQSELPADKSAKIVVYCRSGAESQIAAQTLVSLGYTNVYNLEGGMNAWTDSGRDSVILNRS